MRTVIVLIVFSSLALAGSVESTQTLIQKESEVLTLLQQIDTTRLDNNKIKKEELIKKEEIVFNRKLINQLRGDNNGS